MEEELSLVLEKREALGKKVKALRRQGIVPVHLYGPGTESRSLQAPAAELTKTLTLAGRARPIQVRVKRERKRQLAFVREIQWDPLQGDLLHVDLLQVDVTQLMHAEIPVGLVGEAPALKEPRTSVAQRAFTIEVDFLHTGLWRPYAVLEVPPGQTVRHVFPDGYSAHWLRITASKASTATAWLIYE